jgi:hypothetical protein
MTDKKEITGVDKDGKEVKVFVRKPEPKDVRDSKIAYNKEFRHALESGAILKAKLQDYVKEQGIWSDEKDKQYKKMIDKIRQQEAAIKKGGIPLSKAKDIAIELHKSREEFRNFIAEKQSHEANTAESIAENAQFNFLVSCCVVKADGSRVWQTMDEYDVDSGQPWALEAASELARMLYGLDPNYDKNLVENQFLKKYKFVNDDLRLINKDGHLVDINGRLIDEDGRYVAYRDDKTKYFVNEDGVEVDEKGVVKIEFAPFTDDEGNPIVESPVEEEKKESTDNA